MSLVILTKPQRAALKRVWMRERGVAYRDFRRKVVPGHGYIMVPFAGMWLGIESDGYTHS